MPFALVFIGLVLIVSGAKDTYQQLGRQVVGDFTGPDNFTYWLAALGAVGAAGYVEPLRPFSRAFLGLILTAMVVRNGGVFDKFSEALAKGPLHPQAASYDTPAVEAAATAGAANASNPGLTSNADVNVRAADTQAAADAIKKPLTFLDILGGFGNLFTGLGSKAY